MARASEPAAGQAVSAVITATTATNDVNSGSRERYALIRYSYNRGRDASVHLVRVI